jgi:hypothetical protein
MTPSVIEPATRLFVAYSLNHYATARPRTFHLDFFILRVGKVRLFLLFELQAWNYSAPAVHGLIQLYVQELC